MIRLDANGVTRRGDAAIPIQVASTFAAVLMSGCNGENGSKLFLYRETPCCM